MSLWLIGCGNMGGAMLRRWLAAGVETAGDVIVIDPGLPEVPHGVTLLAALPEADSPDTLVLAVKPQQLADAARMLAGRALGSTLLVSILAGVDVAALARFQAGAIVRAMPNLPVAIGAGVTALYTADPAVRPRAEALAGPLGAVEWIEDEHLFDAVTALSGSGPGFTFRFIDALTHAGTALGLPAAQAARLALATVAGASRMAAEAEADPATLADRVASKGGSTRQGLDVLDREGALVTLLSDTLAAAARRNAELAAVAQS